MTPAYTAAKGREDTCRDYLLRDKIPSELDLIILDVARKHGLTVGEVLSDQRSQRVVRPRQEAMWRASKETLLSLPAIGRAFKKDHTTVMHGIRRHERRANGA